MTLGDTKESVDVRVARLEERSDSLDKRIHALQMDIKDTKQLIANMDQKLDRAIELSRRSVPIWVHYALWFIFVILGIALRGQIKL